MFGGLGGVNPKQMEAMMKKLGMKTETIPATEVIIRGERTLVIKEPQVTMVEVQGQRTFQIVGKVEEKSDKESEEKGVSEEDIKLVVSQTGVSRESAEAVLKETEGDIAEAILRLKRD